MLVTIFRLKPYIGRFENRKEINNCQAEPPTEVEYGFCGEINGKTKFRIFVILPRWKPGTSEPG